MPLPFVISPGTRLYKYDLTARIGGGGFGDVWLANDAAVNKQVALKILEAATVTVDERLTEARIGNQLTHQNLVKVHYADVVPHNGINLVLILEFGPGELCWGGDFAGILFIMRRRKEWLIGLVRVSVRSCPGVDQSRSGRNSLV